MDKITIQDMYTLEETLAASLFGNVTYPWEVLSGIKDYILQLGPALPEDRFERKGENVWKKRKSVAYPV